ncbi:secretin and TonB N-terminal domain-containing protein [Achromobacter insuavis]
MQGLAAGALLATAGLPAAQAQDAAPGAQTAAQATRRYDIPAGPLSATLTRFLGESGLFLAGSTELAQGRTSPGVQGVYSAPAALRALLAGTGLQARIGAGGGYTGSAPQPAPGDAAVLPSITVNGNRESPVGPVSGYIATRTMAAGKDDSALAETPQSVTVVTRDQMNDQGRRPSPMRCITSPASTPRPTARTRAMTGSPCAVSTSRCSACTATACGLRQQDRHAHRLLRPGAPGSHSSSVLYGQNSPGGLINAVTKRPTDDPLHEVTLGVGSHDRKQAQFDLGGPATADGTLLYRLTGNVRDSDTQMRYAPDDHAYIAPALTWKPNADLSLTVLANYQHDRAAWGLWYPRTGTLFSSPWGQISSSFYPGEPDFNRFDRTQKSLGTLLEYKLGGDAVFRQGLRVETMNYDAKYVRGRALLNDDYDLDESGHLLYRDANRNQLRSRVYTMDNQLAWTAQTGPVTHRLLVGLDASLTRYNDRQWSGSAPVLDILDPQYGQPIPDPTSPWPATSPRARPASTSRTACRWANTGSCAAACATTAPAPRRAIRWARWT